SPPAASIRSIIDVPDRGMPDTIVTNPRCDAVSSAILISFQNPSKRNAQRPFEDQTENDRQRQEGDQPVDFPIGQIEMSLGISNSHLHDRMSPLNRRFSGVQKLLPQPRSGAAQRDLLKSISHDDLFADGGVVTGMNVNPADAIPVSPQAPVDFRQT